MVKSDILRKICYTELVYGRINKKLKSNLSKVAIEQFLTKVIEETDDSYIKKIGKNYYITNSNHKLRITINSTTYRVITVDRV